MRIRYESLFVIAFLGLLLSQALSPLSFSSEFEFFPAHDRLVSSVADFRLKMGDRLYHNTVVGPGHWITYATDRAMDQYQNNAPLSEAELDEYEKTVLDFQAFVESRGAQLLLVTVPYKGTIYPERVPGEIQKLGARSQLDQIVERLSPSVHILDLSLALQQAKKGEVDVFLATDTHWNEIGSFIAYREIIMALQPSFRGLAPHKISDYKKSLAPPAVFDLGYMLGSHSLTERGILLNRLFRPVSQMDAVTLPSKRNIAFARTQDASLPSALFFHDSFLYSVRSHLAENFYRVTFVDLAGNSHVPPRAWVEQMQPDVAVIVLSEHFLNLLPNMLITGEAGIEE